MALRALYGGVNTTPVAWLCFEGPIPAAGYAAFFLTPVASTEEAPSTSRSTVTRVPPSRFLGDSTITNGRLTLTVDAATGFLSAYADATTGVNISLTQSWLSYIGFNGKSKLNGSNQVEHEPQCVLI